METNTKFMKDVRQKGAWPEKAWGYGPPGSRMTLAIRQNVGDRYIVNISGSVQSVPEAEARKLAEIALREVNLRPPDFTTQELLHEWGLLASAPRKPRTRGINVYVPERSGRVGFSEIPILMGLSPYATPLSLWRRKKGLESAPVETFPMRWGKEAETAAIRIVQEQLGLVNWRIWRQYPAADGELAGHIDAVAAKQGKRIILEMKVLSSLGAMDAYRAQVNAQMGASGIHDARLCIVYMNRELVIEHIEFSQDLYIQQKALAKDFMRRVREDNPPLLEGLPVKPAADTITVQEGDLCMLMQEYQQLRQQLSPIEDRLEAIKNTIKDNLTTANLHKVITPYGTVTLRSDVREILDAKALKAAYPEIAAQFVKKTSVKSLNIK